jgi:hypothetical protein
MKLSELLAVLEFGARFYICYYKDNRVQEPFFHGNYEDFKKSGLNNLIDKSVKVVQSMPQMEFQIVIKE